MDRLLDSLGVEFEAELARYDDAAADDLALTFLQDSTLAHSLQGQGWRIDPVLETPSAGKRVEEAGLDYVLAGGVVVMTARASFLASAHDPPITSDRTFREVLRGWTRPPMVVDLKAGPSEFRGRLTRAARDYVALSTSVGERLIPLGEIWWVKPLRAEAG